MGEVIDYTGSVHLLFMQVHFEGIFWVKWNLIILAQKITAKEVKSRNVICMNCSVEMFITSFVKLSSLSF